MSFVPDVIKEAARKLRMNMTDAEKRLWEEIKEKRMWYKFLRQKPMYVFTETNGNHRFIIPDFYCAEKNLIIEVDGGVHNEREVLYLDQVKQELLNQKWLQVLRIKNEDVLNNMNTVLRDICNKLTK